MEIIPILLHRQLQYRESKSSFLSRSTEVLLTVEKFRKWFVYAEEKYDRLPVPHNRIHLKQFSCDQVSRLSNYANNLSTIKKCKNEKEMSEQWAPTAVTANQKTTAQFGQINHEEVILYLVLQQRTLSWGIQRLIKSSWEDYHEGNHIISHEHLWPPRRREESWGSHSQAQILSLQICLTSLKNCSISPVEQGSHSENQYTKLPRFSPSLHHLPRNTRNLRSS